MHIAIHSKALASVALAAGVVCGTAHAAESWAPTHTARHAIAASSQGVALRAGESVHVAVSLRMRDQAGMDALTAGLIAGTTSRHLTSEEFLRSHAPTPAQAQAVVDHLSRAGFTHVEVAPNRMLVSADGTAASVKAAFATELRRFQVDGRSAYANVSDAKVPAHLAGIVNAVHGLQNVDISHPMYKLAAADATSDGSAIGHKPTDFPTIYNADSLRPATKSTVAIISAGDISQTLVDLDAFVAQSGFTAPLIEKVEVGAAGTDKSGVIEWNMDSQTSLSAAGGAVEKLMFYVATSLEDAALTETYNRAVSDNTAKAINVSLGECETGAAKDGTMASDDAIFQIAVAQGQVFSVSSGDSGSYQCGSSHGAQSYPAVSPYVIAVGGTLLRTTDTTSWAEETVWGCNGQLLCLLLGGTGGGVSGEEAAPDWQIKSGVLGTSLQRGVPDIAFDGDPSSGALVLNGGKLTQVGGTSLAAPLFAGFWARLQSNHDNALVFPAEALYHFGKRPRSANRILHDVTSGSNGGYKAAAGWDYASGFGSLNIAEFSRFISTHSGL